MASARMLFPMRGEDRSAVGRSPLGSPVPAVVFSARVLFVEFSDSRLLLDCLVYEDRSQEESSGAWRSGIPLTMELALPTGSWVDFARAALERWADRSTRLLVELGRRPVGPRVRITDGSTSITFEPVAR